MLIASKSKNKETDTILARNKYLRRDSRPGSLNGNIMLVGATGRGKTHDFIKPNIMQMNMNYVVLDTHGTLVRELGTMLENNGYEIKVLNLADPEHSDTFNPFRYIQDEADVYKMIDYLMASINPPPLSKRASPHYDPFYDNAAKALLSAICFYLIEVAPQEEQTMDSVHLLLRSHKVSWDEELESTLDVLFKDHKEKYPSSTAVKQYAIFKALVGSPVTTASVLSSAAVYLQYFNIAEICKLTSADSINLESLCYEKAALFVIPSPADRTKNWLTSLFFSQLIDVLTRRENKYGIRLFLDDFLFAGAIPDFYDKLALFQSHSRFLSCVISVHDEAQLENEYGTQGAQSIITNCDSYVFMGSPNIDLCNTVARRLGKRFITGRSLRRLSRKKCVVISGRKGAICKRYNIKKHPRYKEVVDFIPPNQHEHITSSCLYDLEKYHHASLGNYKFKRVKEDLIDSAARRSRPAERMVRTRPAQSNLPPEDFIIAPEMDAAYAEPEKQPEE